jgi:hypothetical protein
MRKSLAGGGNMPLLLSLWFDWSAENPDKKLKLELYRHMFRQKCVINRTILLAYILL